MNLRQEMHESCALMQLTESAWYQEAQNKKSTYSDEQHNAGKKRRKQTSTDAG